MDPNHIRSMYGGQPRFSHPEMRPRPNLVLPVSADGQQMALRSGGHLQQGAQDLSPSFDLGTSGVRARPMGFRGVSPPQYQPLPNLSVQSARRFPTMVRQSHKCTNKQQLTPQQVSQQLPQQITPQRLSAQVSKLPMSRVLPSTLGQANLIQNLEKKPPPQFGPVAAAHFRPMQQQSFNQNLTAPPQQLPPQVFASNNTSSAMSDVPASNLNGAISPSSQVTPSIAGWLSPSIAQQCALTAAALRVEGAFEEREFTYTEGYLRGLADCERVPNIEEKLTGVLTGISGMKPQVGSWVSECWRALVDPENIAAASGRLSKSQSGFNGELWIKKYSEPISLRHFHCVRMFSPEHLVVPPHFPLNARRVKEAAVSPQFMKMLPALGFRCSSTNTAYVSALLFHMNPGASDGHLLILVQKCFKEATLTEELFPGKILVEIIGRVADDTLIENLSRRIIDTCRHLQP